MTTGQPALNWILGVRRRPIIGARAPAKEGFLSGGRDNPGRGAKTTLDDADEVVPLLD